MPTQSRAWRKIGSLAKPDQALTSSEDVVTRQVVQAAPTMLGECGLMAKECAIAFEECRGIMIASAVKLGRIEAALDSMQQPPLRRIMTSSPSLSATAVERRIAPRFQPAFRTICRLDTNGARPTIGFVWNLSESGVSMLMAKPPKPGTELTGELVAEDGGAGVRVSIRVVHVRPTTTGDYVLGARFETPLGAKEIKVFLVAPPLSTRTTNGTGPKNWSPPPKG
jgi:hypothetical protein